MVEKNRTGHAPLALQGVQKDTTPLNAVMEPLHLILAGQHSVQNPPFKKFSLTIQTMSRCIPCSSCLVGQIQVGYCQGNTTNDATQCRTCNATSCKPTQVWTHSSSSCIHPTVLWHWEWRTIFEVTLTNTNKTGHGQPMPWH